MKSYYKYWGKADKQEDGSYSSHLLLYHALDVASVASVLLQKESRVLKKLSAITGVEENLLLQFLLFLVAIHDIGKFSITFQNIVPELLKFLQAKSSSKKYQYDKARHDQLGMYLFDAELSHKFYEYLDKAGISRANHRMVNKIIRILANTSLGHHGIPPRSNANVYVGDYFEADDQNAVKEFFDDMASFFLPGGLLISLLSSLENDREILKRMIKELKLVTWNLAGIITQSDWIASGSDFSFQSTHESIEEYWNKIKPRAEAAVEKTGIVPTPPNKSTGFSYLFPEYTVSATDLQKKCNEIELTAGPQLFILEDLTGSGKTEAAMTLVSRMMASGKADGCFIGLPTMATANAMYSRMKSCYRKLFAEDRKPSIVLSHGARHLSEEFRSSILTNVADENIDRPELSHEEVNSGKFHCTNWLADSTKKSLLSDIGVGTIDQLLMSILPVRYQNLRYHGMTNKVLVVDEVHAYDPYMNRLLRAVLRAHSSAGGSAVLLSATIPHELKTQLIKSFYDGIGIEESDWFPIDHFPLISRVDNSGTSEVFVNYNQKNRQIDVELLYDGEATCKQIKHDLDNGRCVSWIRNTVSDVFDAYNKLTMDYGISEKKIIVFHSRFAYSDRMRIEEQVLGLFGKESSKHARVGKLVLATQVIEQSLDLDFDVMVSDLAPIELLIQRAGRLHRHERGDRGFPKLYVLCPPEADSPEADWYKSMFPKAAYVYKNTTILWRTKEMLKKEKAIILPQRARELVESVYGEDPIVAPECFIDNETEAEGERMAQVDTADFSKLSIEKGYSRESALNEWDEEEKVSTRLSDAQTTIYLCRFEGKELYPVFDGNFPWEMSSLKVRRGTIDEIKYDGGITKEISRLKKQRKFRDDDIFLVVQSSADEDMIVEIDLGEKKVRYTRNFGLRVDEK